MEIIQQLRKHQRLELTLLLMASCFLSFGLIVLRVMVTHQFRFIFLIWNLFLAFIPFFIANWLYLFRERFNRFTILPAIGMWLLFFPNAPYIITDLIHLHPTKELNYWYSLLIVVSCAWNALIMGLLSLSDVQHVVADKFGKLTGWMLVVSSVFLGAFGIYIGRIMRWNSWDLFFDTKNLMYDIGERFNDPSAHGRTLGITIFYGIFLLMSYLLFRQLATREPIK